MPGYSVHYLDALGRTLATESRSFENNKVATDFARIGLVSNDTVEVWVGDDFVVRLYRDGSRESRSETPRTQAVASLRVERRQALDEWDNEGGGIRRAT
jgi:hypothetical protein